MLRVPQTLDRIEATFDDPYLVSSAGLLLVATLSQPLGLEDFIDATVCLGGRVGGARPGRKTSTLAHALCAGAGASTTRTYRALARLHVCSVIV